MVRTIAARSAEELVAGGGVDVVDVREPHEWATGHVPGARLVPLGRLRADLPGAGIGPKVLFVCESGGRSLQAAKFAEAHGVVDVYSLEGGTSGWRAAGLPVEAPPSRSPTEANAAPSAETDADPELNSVVAANFKALRKRSGHTLDTLAGLSGVSRQTLGQLELGLATLNLGTLWKLAGVFEVPFSALLARPGKRETRLFRSTNAKRIVGVDGRFSSRALFSPDDGGTVEFYELWLAPHARENAEPHAPGTVENLVVTVGRLVLERGSERFELAKGDAIVFTADVPHSYVNLGAEECWMNLVMTYPGTSRH